MNPIPIWTALLGGALIGGAASGLLYFKGRIAGIASIAAGLLSPRPGEVAWRLGGAAVFGLGWGLSGYCPGPALVSLVTGSPPVLVFVAFMAAGLRLARIRRND